jgi:tetratricopeptide (TPR) repeat protein
MEEKKPQNSRPILLALCNFNSFGLGYFLSGLKSRWLLSLLANILFLVTAQFTNASKNPVLWAAIFLLLFSGMSIDLWLQLRKKPELIPEKLSRQPFLLPTIALLSNLIFFGAFFAYRWAGNDLILKGDTAFAANNYIQSSQNYSSVSRYFTLSLNPAIPPVINRQNEVNAILSAQEALSRKDYAATIDSVAKFTELFPASTKKSDVINLGIDAYVSWAEDLRGKNDFEGSLQKLQLVQNDYLKDHPERSSEIENVIAQDYLLWGQQLTQNKDYLQGIDKLELVTVNYPKSDFYAQSFQGAAQAHYDLALQYMDGNSYELALEQLQKIQDVYQTTPVQAKASEAFPQALLGWGRSLEAQNSFILAIEKFNGVKQYTSDATVLAEAENEIQNAIQLIANDSGTDGTSVLNEAMLEACSGNIPTNPSVGILNKEQGKAAVCGEILIPWELMADTPGDFRYVIFREDTTKRIQSCPYTGGHTLERWINTSLITVKLVTSQDIFSKKTFTGAPPTSCPNEYGFSGTVDQSWGDPVNMDDISAWVATILK